MPLVKLATAWLEVMSALLCVLGLTPPDHLLLSLQFPLVLESHFCATKFSAGVIATLSYWAHGLGSIPATPPVSEMISTFTPLQLVVSAWLNSTYMSRP